MNGKITGRWAPMAAAAAAAACWGLGIVISKAALAHFPPLNLFIIQLSASVLFLWGALVLRPQQFAWRGRARLAAGATGLLEPGLAYFLGVIGLNLTTAGNASLLSASEPAFVVLISWLILREPPRPRTAAAVLAAFLGVALVIGPDSLAGIKTFSFSGDALILAGTVCAAFYVVFSHGLAQDAEPLPLLAIQQGFALIFALLVFAAALPARGAIFHVSIAAFSGVSNFGWGLAIVSGLLQFALTFWLYLIGLKKLPVNTAALFLALIPVFGVGGACLFLGERLRLIQAAGALLIIAAVVAAAA